MKYATVGKEIMPEFKLPLVYSDSLLWPAPDDGYYGLVFAEDGTLLVEDALGKKSFPAPLSFALKPGHSVASIACSGDAVHSLVFSTDAVNANGIPNVPESFFFSPFAALPASGYAAKSLPVTLGAQIASLCKKIDDNLNRHQGNFWPCMSRSFFLELLILLERNRYLSASAPEMTVPGTGGPIGPVFEYMHACYDQACTLESLASRFATNRTTLNELFQKECGMTAIAYLNAVRLEVATALLRNTLLPISVVSERAGFSDESYFSRVFRKKTGLPPAAWRKACPYPYAAS